MKVQLQVRANVLIWDPFFVYVCLHFGNVTLEVCRTDNEQTKTCFWEIVILKTRIFLCKSIPTLHPVHWQPVELLFGKTFGKTPNLHHKEWMPSQGFSIDILWVSSPLKYIQTCVKSTWVWSLKRWTVTVFWFVHILFNFEQSPCP